MNKIVFGFCIIFVGIVLGRNHTQMFDGEDWETGFVPIGKGNSDFWYLLIKSRDHNKTAPILIWLNGGPGCSSLLGCFEEMGPYVIDKDTFKFKENHFPWNTYVDMVYVDQPIGIGFSIAYDNKHLCNEEICVARDFYRFLMGLYEKHPEFRGRDLYLSGESYAGHYIPAMGKYIVSAKNPDVKLKGVAIGNFNTDWPTEMQAFHKYLYEHWLVYWPFTMLWQTAGLACYIAKAAGFDNKYLTSVCGLNVGDPGTNTSGLIVNVYDIRENVSWDPVDLTVEKMLRLPDVQKYLNVNLPSFNLTNFTILKSFDDDASKSYIPHMEYMLDHDVDVMVFYGDMDFLCNWRGGEYLTSKYYWKGRDGWMRTKPIKTLTDSRVKNNSVRIE